MKELIDALTWVHITAGCLSLVAAPAAMIAAKGGKQHRLFGKLFFWAIVVTCVTSIITGFWHAAHLLVLISFFSFQLVASGYRALHLKKLHRGLRPKRIDFILNGGGALVNLIMLFWGLAHIVLQNKSSSYWIYVVFGLVGLWFALSRMRRFYVNSVDQRQWLYDHISGFIGGYIASLSAFSVNVLLKYIPMPMLVAWLWPTAIGTPLIILWIRYYRKRLAKGAKLRNMVKEIRISSVRPEP